VPIVAVLESPSLTQDAYDELTTWLSGKSRMETPSDWPFEGLLAHIAGQGPHGFRVVDVWESDEAFHRFGETLMPILQTLGIDVEPEVYPAHAFVTA
jgi:hypothetical protein